MANPAAQVIAKDLEFQAFVEFFPLLLHLLIDLAADVLIGAHDGLAA
jgi:hypothetical protein